jgi:hypothetical protein
MKKDNNSDKKIEQLIDLNLRILIFLMYKSGYTMDQICKNLHINKMKVVELLKGLNKNRQ